VILLNASSWFEKPTLRMHVLRGSRLRFSLLPSAFCHDTNHNDLNNVFNIWTKTLFSILYENMCVMEMYHAHESIVIITRQH
jgi:predicted small integral membrane protein